MRKNNRAARAARIQLHSFEVSVKRRREIFRFEVLAMMRCLPLHKNHWCQLAERTLYPFLAELIAKLYFEGTFSLRQPSFPFTFVISVLIINITLSSNVIGLKESLFSILIGFLQIIGQSVIRKLPKPITIKTAF